MSQIIESNVKTFTNGPAAIGRYLRVTLISGVLWPADSHEAEVGVTVFRADANAPAAVYLRTAAGTLPMIAAGVISAGEAVYAAADGKVAATGTRYLGTALEAATGNGDVFEVLPTRSVAAAQNSVATVAAAGSAQGDAALLTAVTNVVTGGNDTTGVRLPTAAIGEQRMILNSGTAGLKIYPATGGKINNGSANAAITILENTLAILVATAEDHWGAVYTVNS